MKNFLIGICCSLILLSISSRTFAQDTDLSSEAISSSPASSEGALDYQLPYPGLLPDNPLYPLKTLRDRIISFMIADPAKKAEFNLLQSDKRLNAGLYLFNKQPRKQQLAVSTISKGVNYLELAIKDVKEAKKQGKEISDLIRRMNLSTLKHQQIIKPLREKSNPTIKSQFEIIEKKLTGLEKEATSFIPE